MSRYIRSGGRTIKTPHRAPIPDFLPLRLWLIANGLGVAYAIARSALKHPAMEPLMSYEGLLAVLGVMIAGCVVWLRRSR